MNKNVEKWCLALTFVSVFLFNTSVSPMWSVLSSAWGALPALRRTAPEAVTAAAGGAVVPVVPEELPREAIPFVPFAKGDRLCLADYIELLDTLCNREGDGPFVTSENKGCATREEALTLVGLPADSLPEYIYTAFRSWLYWHDMLMLEEMPFTEEDIESLEKLSGLRSIFEAFPSSSTVKAGALRLALGRVRTSEISMELRALLNATVLKADFCGEISETVDFKDMSKKLSATLQGNLFKERISPRTLEYFAAEMVKIIYIINREQTFAHMRAISGLFDQRPLNLPAAS